MADKVSRLRECLQKLVLGGSVKLPTWEANASVLAIKEYQKNTDIPKQQTKMKTETKRPFPNHDHDLVLPKALAGHCVIKLQAPSPGCWP